METTKIYNRSDFDLLLDLRDIEGIDHAEILNCDIEGVCFTGGSTLGKHYVFSRIEGECVNCEAVEGNKLRVLFDSHGLPPGVLKAEIRVSFDDPSYPDGKRTQVCRHELGIELVKEGCLEPVTPVCEVTLPYLFASAYDLARRQGYTGTREDYMRAVVSLVDTVNAAQQTLADSLHAASEAVRLTTAAAETLTRAETAAESAETAGTFADEQGRRAQASADAATESAISAQTQAQRAEAVADAADQFARTDLPNTFAQSQTFTGNITVLGDIFQQGATYVTHTEEVRSKNDYIILRDDAESGLGAHRYAGFEIRNYNGTDTCLLAVNAAGEARVGDYGMGIDDTQPLLTRAETADLHDGDLLRWDAGRMCAVPLRVQPIDLEATFEDDPDNPVTYWLVSLPDYVPPTNNA